MSGFRMCPGGAAFSQTEGRNSGRNHYSSVEPIQLQVCTHRWVPYLHLHQPDYHHFLTLCPDDSLTPCPTQLAGPPKPLPVVFPYIWPVSAHAKDPPKISQRFTKPKEGEYSLSVPYISCSTAQILAPVAAAFSLQLSLFQVPLSSAKVANICRSHCRSY